VSGLGRYVWSVEQPYATTWPAWGVAEMSGPYQSAKEYLTADCDTMSFPSKRANTSFGILRLATESIPDFMESGRHCPPSPTDLNYQKHLRRQ
jgi:hypothetical protein